MKRLTFFIIYVLITLTLINKKFSLKDELKSLKEKLFATVNILSLLSKENSYFSLTNKYILWEKEKSNECANNIQLIINNWAHSHFNVTKIINFQFLIGAWKFLVVILMMLSLYLKRSKPNNLFRILMILRRTLNLDLLVPIT